MTCSGPLLNQDLAGMVVFVTFPDPQPKCVPYWVHMHVWELEHCCVYMPGLATGTRSSFSCTILIWTAIVSVHDFIHVYIYLILMQSSMMSPNRKLRLFCFCFFCCWILPWAYSNPAVFVICLLSYYAYTCMLMYTACVIYITAITFYFSKLMKIC